MGYSLDHMSFLSLDQIQQLNEKITSDPVMLDRLYKTKKDSYIHKSIESGLLEDYLREGWEEEKSTLKTRAKVRKLKPHSHKFEDDVWCQLYELGYRMLNIDQTYNLPFSSSSEDTKQIDVIAVNEDSVLIFECKSSEHRQSAPSFKDELESMKLRMDGYRKGLRQLFGNERKIKLIFATRNLRINRSGEDFKRIGSLGAYYYDDNTYEYVNNLIQKYKKASLYQFQGLIFKGQNINNNPIIVPALMGQMGGRDYFVFSMEPTLLLKLGFVLHRTRANDAEFPTYQRLLVPSRLGGISKFIDGGGYFPNSIIINFNTNKNKLVFEANSKIGDSRSRAGMLKIPNAYGIAYIIDGQHRVYGYANSEYVESNTIPVVAFNDLDSGEQLKMFMDINQNQRAVSPNLKLDLEEDLFWDSDRVDSRMKALKSSIVKDLSNNPSSPLFRRISVGEDKAELALKPFYSALGNSKLLPSAKGNKYISDDVDSGLYDVGDHDHSRAMNHAKKDVSALVMMAYDFVFQNYPSLVTGDKSSLILSNRGAYAFICTLGSINHEMTKNGLVRKKMDVAERFQELRKYLAVLLESLLDISPENKDHLLSLLGGGADIEWLRYFQSLINKSIDSYNPAELVDWHERQDKELQNRAREVVVIIERWLKKSVLHNLRELFGANWELEINAIKRECLKRAEEEKERYYKEGLGVKETLWTDMLTVTDYRQIVSKYWSNTTDSPDFKTFSELFAIDIGEEFRSKSDKMRWMSHFSSLRNSLAHEGTKGRGLNHDEVAQLESISSSLMSRQLSF